LDDFDMAQLEWPGIRRAGLMIPTDACTNKQHYSMYIYGGCATSSQQTGHTQTHRKHKMIVFAADQHPLLQLTTKTLEATTLSVNSHYVLCSKALAGLMLHTSVSSR
jgi:hypothetical protein